MLFRRLLFLCAVLTPLLPGAPATVLVVPLHNESAYSDLDWIGESVSETLITELSAAGEIVLDRDARDEGFRQLELKSGALLTKATLIKLGQTLDSDHVCYGSYSITPAASDSQLRDGSISIHIRFLDLRKFRDDSELSESGKLVDLSRLEEQLAWQAVHRLNPQTTLTAEQFVQPSKLVRLDAKESFIRGLLAAANSQKLIWFKQAVRLDARYPQPAFELGKLALSRKDYRQAADWFGRIPAGDPLYLEARFRMGLSAYWAGDFATAERCFRELSQQVPLNEVFNNLGAAESRLKQPSALDDVNRALDGDETDVTYQFNAGLLLYQNAKYAQAASRFRTVLDRNPNDRDAKTLLERCENETPADAAAGAKLLGGERLKANFDLTAFRQLKAMLQSSKP